MIAENELVSLVAPATGTPWFKDRTRTEVKIPTLSGKPRTYSATPIESFLLDQFCNKRNHLHLKTAAFWKHLIQYILAKEEPALRVPPARRHHEWEYDPAETWKFNLDSYARLILAAGGYTRLEEAPASNQNQHAAEIFGLQKNSAKVTLFRLRREADKFFDRGGEYIPKQRPAPKAKAVDPLKYDLDVPVLKGHQQWKHPTYRMNQKSPALSSMIEVCSQDGDRSSDWYNSLDEILYYDHARFKGFVARLPCPSPVKNEWEYPSFENEFWANHVIEQHERCTCPECILNPPVFEPGFIQGFEAEYAYQAALQSCLAEIADKKYLVLPFAHDLEGRAVLPFSEDQRTDPGKQETSVDEPAIKDNLTVEELREPKPRKFEITIRRSGANRTIGHSHYGSGDILKVNGNTVCCKFPEAGRVNLSVGTIQRKTKINLKKAIRLQEAIEIVRNRNLSAVNAADDSLAQSMVDKSSDTILPGFIPTTSEPSAAPRLTA